MQINVDLVKKLKVAAHRSLDAYLEKVLKASVEHGNFGMDLLDGLRNQLPATKCANCGKCCNSVSIFSLEYHRTIRHLMTCWSPERLRRFLYSAMRPDLRQAEVGDQTRLRCLFRDEETRVCLIHQVRPFACRIFGLLKEDNTRECDKVEDLVFPPQPVSDTELTNLQAKVMEYSESYQACPDTEAISFFPFEFWVYRYLFSPQRALQLYREVLVPISTPLQKFWKQRANDMVVCRK